MKMARSWLLIPGPFLKVGYVLRNLTKWSNISSPPLHTPLQPWTRSRFLLLLFLLAIKLVSFPRSAFHTTVKQRSACAGIPWTHLCYPSGTREQDADVCAGYYVMSNKDLCLWPKAWNIISGSTKKINHCRLCKINLRSNMYHFICTYF